MRRRGFVLVALRTGLDEMSTIAVSRRAVKGFFQFTQVWKADQTDGATRKVTFPLNGESAPNLFV